MTGGSRGLYLFPYRIDSGYSKSDAAIKEADQQIGATVFAKRYHADLIQ
ncbi:MAG: hypothetical protein RIK87_21135 [Fuerstiella sp.]